MTERIIYQNIEISVEMPKLISELITLVRKIHPNVDQRTITNIVLAKTAQMITAKRVKYNLLEQNLYPNHYAIVFMPSGYGKDLISNELDEQVFNNFRLWFKDKEETYIEKQRKAVEEEARNEYPLEKQKYKRKKYFENEFSKIRRLPIEVSKGTPEGLFANACAFKKAGFGCIMVKYSEFGLLLKNAKNEDDKVIQSLFELYDGKLSSKSIKSENNSPNVEDVPCNTLLYSDPSLFAKDLKCIFNMLIQTGLGRRATISYMPEQKLTIETNPDIAYENKVNFLKESKEIGDKLFSIFNQIQSGNSYKITEETYKQVFYPFKVQLNNLANEEEDSLLERELRSREFKALKLSCLFAVINHVNELTINPTDMRQAIGIVNLLGNDFKSFINIKPSYRKDLYERVFDFFKESIGKEYSMTELKRNHYNVFGCSRKTFDKEFGEIIKYVAEIATEKGFLFNEIQIKPKGTKYSLTEIPSDNLSDGIFALEQLI